MQWFPTYYAASFYEDIVQAGLFGIFDAIRHYNLEEKTVFSTFAMHYIKGAIKQTIMEETNKTSYHFSRLGRIIKDAQTKLKNSGIAHPTRDQIVAETGLSYLVINNAKSHKRVYPKTKQEKTIAGYPSREKMIECAKAHYPDGMIEILLTTFGIEKIEDATNEQLASVWNKYGK